ncbi:hypothetical protein PWT90_01449 [Aphanocladium album]|nr:hypothetical protein PWT90_01449 [Aphanocladium album]
MPSSLSNRLDLDVYHVVKRLEQSNNDGKLFKTVSAAYSAIKGSNSSLSRQKKRPLEDALFRVLDVRKHEQAQDESDDSEAAIDVDEPESKGEDRFLLNRQITKLWNVEPATMPSSNGGDQPAKKKRRVETEGGDDKNNTRATSEGPTAASTPKEAKETKADGSKLQRKTPRGPVFDLESEVEGPRLGGLGDIYNDLLCQTKQHLFVPDLYQDDLSDRARLYGVALTGPPLIGKKSYIRAIAAQLRVPLINLTRCFQDAERIEKSLAEAFDAALASAPCIIYINHIEHYIPRSSDAAQNDHHQRVLGLFLKQMERVWAQQAPILCMVTAAREADLNTALTAPGLVEECIQLRVPNVREREDILRQRMGKDATTARFDLTDLARKLDGFVGGDIHRLVRRAGVHAGNRLITQKFGDRIEWARATMDDEMELDEIDDGGFLDDDKPYILDDFTAALKDYVPSLRKEGFTAIPNVTWDQVGGLRSVRDQLNVSIIGPITRPDVYAAFGLTRATGCLLWGPPGCGKTLVAQAVANQAQASFILINGPELLNKYVGESERAVRELFARARSSTPCILFFDEFDSVVPRRDGGSGGGGSEAGTRVVNALLTELDGAQDRSGIYVIGTTNRPDMIDEAILRPGRLSEQLFLDLPTPEERVDILRAIYRTRHVGASAAEFARLEAIARDDRCRDFSGADLSGLHTKAAEFAVRRYLAGGDEAAAKEIGQQDWEDALAVTRRSVGNPEAYRKLRTKLARAM